MIVMETQEIKLLQQIEDIDQWVVWFRTPLGLFDNVRDAIESCTSNDLSPQLCVVPVAVAIGNGELYETAQ